MQLQLFLKTFKKYVRLKSKYISRLLGRYWHLIFDCLSVPCQDGLNNFGPITDELMCTCMKKNSTATPLKLE